VADRSTAIRRNRSTPTGPDRPAATGRDRPPLVRRVHAIPTAPALVILVTLLCVTGLVMVGSASPVVSLITYHSPWTIFFRQVLWMVVGVGALLVFSRVDYRKWRAWSVPIVGGTLLLLLAVLVPGLGVTAGGSSRWIGFGLLRLQPSELMKLALVVFAADIVVKRMDRSAPAKQVIARSWACSSSRAPSSSSSPTWARRWCSAASPSASSS